MRTDSRLCFRNSVSNPIFHIEDSLEELQTAAKLLLLGSTITLTCILYRTRQIFFSRILTSHTNPRVLYPLGVENKNSVNINLEVAMQNSKL